MRKPDHLAVLFIGHEDLHAYRAYVFGQGHYEFFADRVDGRICDLCELLSEIVEQKLRFFRQYGQRGVVSHGGYRFGAVRAHRHDDSFDVFYSESEIPQQYIVVLHSVFHFPPAFESVEFYPVRRQPLPVRHGRGHFLFQFCIIAYLSFLSVHYQHFAWLQTAFFKYLVRFETYDPGFARHDHHSCLGDKVSGRAQSVPVQHPACIAPVGKQQGGGPVPWLHQDRMVFIEGFQIFADGVFVIERFRYKHGHGMRKAHA